MAGISVDGEKYRLHGASVRGVKVPPVRRFVIGKPKGGPLRRSRAVPEPGALGALERAGPPPPVPLSSGLGRGQRFPEAASFIIWASSARAEPIRSWFPVFPQGPEGSHLFVSIVLLIPGIFSPK